MRILARSRGCWPRPRTFMLFIHINRAVLFEAHSTLIKDSQCQRDRIPDAHNQTPTRNQDAPTPIIYHVQRLDALSPNATPFHRHEVCLPSSSIQMSKFPLAYRSQYQVLRTGFLVGKAPARSLRTTLCLRHIAVLEFEEVPLPIKDPLCRHKASIPSIVS